MNKSSTIWLMRCLLRAGAPGIVALACSQDVPTAVEKFEESAAPRRTTAASSPAPQLAAAAMSTCGRSIAGVVTCWGGDGRFGQLIVPATLTSATQISAGDQHYCALEVAGAVKCWGYNLFGQSSPPGGLGAVTAISAGELDTCARKPDGAVICWGFNLGGQAVIPVSVGPVLEIAAGLQHNCAIKLDGTVACWGTDTNGQAAVPPALGAVSQIGAGNFHNCALRSDETVACWGDNGLGQTNVPAGLAAVVSVVAGNSHNCAIKRDATVACWGLNSSGQSTVPAGLVSVVDVAAGGMHTCAVRTDGTVICWGANPDGQTEVPAGLNLGATVAPNVPPVASAGGPYVGSEGSPLSLSLSASDADAGDAISFTWDLGDGTTGSGSVPPSSHAYSDDGTYTITLTASDDGEEASTAIGSAVVVNVAPLVEALSGPVGPIPVNTTALLSAVVADGGTLDSHSAVLDWGDGTTSLVNASAGVVGASHTYADAGVYSVVVVATDDDGGVSNTSIFEYVVVFDPSAGFVTGSGWIESPAGSFTGDPTISGRASFGFVSRYRKGANIPDGDTEFKFAAAGLTFAGTSYQWLVIAGAKAQFKGEGTLNGVSGHQFIVTASDGHLAGATRASDRFRIKIMNNGGGVIYDNQMNASDAASPTTELGGGNIVIHSK